MQKANYLNIAVYFILALLVMWGVSEHFLHLQQLGVMDSDEFFYWQTYKDWAVGIKTLTFHYRPFAYFFYSQFYKLFPNDYYHKVVNGLLDLTSVLIFMQISRKFFSSWFVGACAGLIYFCSPIPIEHSRHGTLHSATAAFLAAAVYFYLAYSQERKTKLKLSFAFFSGIILSCAANTHPDIGVMFPVFSLGFIFNIVTASDKKMLKEEFFCLATFIGGFFLVFLFVFAHFGFSETILGILNNQKEQKTGAARGFGENLFRISYHYIRYSTSKLNVVLFSAGTGFVLFKIFTKKFWPKNLLIFIILISSYLFLCNIFFGRTIIPRLFIPFIVMSYIVWLDGLNRILPLRFRIPVLATLTVLCILTARIERPKPWFIPENEGQSYPKILHKQAFHKMDMTKNFLATPFLIYHIHMFLEKEVYMNGKGLYLALLNEESIANAIKNRNIHYVVWSRIWLDERIFGRNMKTDVVKRLKTYYGLEPVDYTVDKEFEMLKKQIEPFHPKLIHESSEFTIFKLNLPKQEEI